MNELEQKIELNVFPNPAIDYLALYVQPGFQNNMSAVLMNTLGESLQIQTNIQPANTYAFDLSRLPSGIYFLKLEGDRVTAVEKVIVNR
jgi:hypothetical protein